MCVYAVLNSDNPMSMGDYARIGGVVLRKNSCDFRKWYAKRLLTVVVDSYQWLICFNSYLVIGLQTSLWLCDDLDLFDWFDNEVIIDKRAWNNKTLED